VLALTSQQWAVHWVEGAGARDARAVGGQAFGTAPGECGFALAIKQQGLHVVGHPWFPTTTGSRTRTLVTAGPGGRKMGTCAPDS
jgi:hypothetical protein